MALAPLNWRMLTPLTLQTGNVNALIDLIYTMGQSVTYADGTTRTPGTGSAWTWTRDQANAVQPGVTTAAIGVPPINPLNVNYIVAGSTGTPASGPTMNTDGYVTGAPMIGMNKNSGAYTTWTNALPFTSGFFSGFIAASLSGYAVAGTVVYIWESEEGCVFNFVRSTVASLFGLGALIDPLSSAAANAETDGCLYSIFTTGRTNNLSYTFLSDAVTTTTPFYGSANNNQSHWYTFIPGSGSIRATLRGSTTTGYSSLTLSSGKIVLFPYQMVYSTGAYAGQLRNMLFMRNAVNAIALQYGGTVFGYAVGANGTAQTEALLLQY